jgi:hypothetical protein
MPNHRDTEAQRGKPQNFVEKGVPSAQMEVLKATIAQEELR